MIQIFGRRKCKATKAAQRFFSDRGAKIHFIDLAEKALSAGELGSVARSVGVRSLYDAARDDTPRSVGPTDAQLERDLPTHPEWLVTPIVRRGPAAAVGSAPERWQALWDAERAG